MLSVGPTDAITGVLFESTPRRTLFVKHGLLWHHYSMVHGDVEVGKFSCFFSSPLSAIKYISFFFCQCHLSIVQINMTVLLYKNILYVILFKLILITTLWKR